MLQGDAEAPARRVAEELGIGYSARLLPEQKIEACATGGEARGRGDGRRRGKRCPRSRRPPSVSRWALRGRRRAGDGDVALMQDDLPKLAEAVRLAGGRADHQQNVFISIAIKGTVRAARPVRVGGAVARGFAIWGPPSPYLNGLRWFRRGSN